MSWVMHIGKYMENSNGNEGERPWGAAHFFDVMVRDIPQEQQLAVTYSQGDLCLHDMLGSLLLWPAFSQQEKHLDSWTA